MCKRLFQFPDNISRRNRLKTIKELEEIYPELTKDAFDISLPEGWVDIVTKLLNCLHNWVIYNDLQDDEKGKTYLSHVRISQIKEKFGTLRFYYKIDESTDTYISDTIHGAVMLTEYLSEHTCLKCGKDGSKLCNIHGWYATLCDEHEKQLMNNNETL